MAPASLDRTSFGLPLRCQACPLVRRSKATFCPFKNARKPSGTMLLHQGQTPPQLIYLRRGQVALTSSTPNGNELACAVRGPDTMLGLEAVLGVPLPYQVRAVSDVTLCFLEREALDDWLGPLHSPMGALLRYSIEDAARRVGERQALAGTARRRVARFLLQQAETGAADEPLETPNRVLAAVLRMRPETLSRALAELKELGALAKGRAVRVVDLSQLRSAAENDA